MQGPGSDPGDFPRGSCGHPVVGPGSPLTAPPVLLNARVDSATPAVLHACPWASLWGFDLLGLVHARAGRCGQVGVSHVHLVLTPARNLGWSLLSVGLCTLVTEGSSSGKAGRASAWLGGAVVLSSAETPEGARLPPRSVCVCVHVHVWPLPDPLTPTREGPLGSRAWVEFPHLDPRTRCQGRDSAWAAGSLASAGGAFDTARPAPSLAWAIIHCGLAAGSRPNARCCCLGERVSAPDAARDYLTEGGRQGVGGRRGRGP